MAYAVKTTILLLLAVVLRSHVQAGDARDRCRLSDIIVSQESTGKVVEGQREYRVTIENRCACPQADIKVRCYGIITVQDIDKGEIRPLGSGLCIIANGRPVTKGSPVIFTYALQAPQDFSVVTAKPRC